MHSLSDRWPATHARLSDRLLLSIDEVAASRLPLGELVHDHLPHDRRDAVGRLALDALGRWRASTDELLTIDGICLSEILETELFANVFLPVVRVALGVAAAVDADGRASVRIAGGDDYEHLAAHAAAASRGIPVVGETISTVRHRETTLDARASMPGALPLRVMKRMGFPSRLRKESVVVTGYWTHVSMVDRMLMRGARPALVLQSPLPGRRRSLATAKRGGWLGQPGRLAERRGGQLLDRVLESFAPHPLAIEGIELGVPLHHGAAAILSARGPDTLGRVAHLRRAFRSRAARCVVVSSDMQAEARALVSASREAGIPVVGLEHGIGLIASSIVDLWSADVVGVWSVRSPLITPDPDRATVVGYPTPHSIPSLRPPRKGGVRRVVVIGQGYERLSPMLDPRVPLRHYATAVAAVRRAFPSARITLRPHPVFPAPPLDMVAPGHADVHSDKSSPILDLLAEHDLCIGAASTATLQAALVGTPVVVLNVTGFDWLWPFDGSGPVKLARSEDELVDLLSHLEGQSESSEASNAALLEALGATIDDPVRRRLDLIASVAASRG